MRGSDSAGWGGPRSTSSPSAAAAKVSIDVPIGHQTNCLIGLTMNTKRPVAGPHAVVLTGTVDLDVGAVSPLRSAQLVVELVSGVQI